MGQDLMFSQRNNPYCDLLEIDANINRLSLLDKFYFLFLQKYYLKCS